MQREQIEALHRRVAELEAALELRWADIAHLDTKLADVLDRAEQAEARERVLREALVDLVSECEEYARINHLHNADGSPATTGAMKHARAALSAHKEGGE